MIRLPSPAPRRLSSTTTFSMTAYGEAERVRFGITFKYAVATTVSSASSTKRWRPGDSRIRAKAVTSAPSLRTGSFGCNCRQSRMTPAKSPAPASRKTITPAG